MDQSLLKLIDYDYRGVSSHVPMSMDDRAAQFSPFAALTGFGDVIDECERETADELDLSEYQVQEINQTLGFIRENISQHPSVSVVCFVSDETKSGGRFETLTGHVTRISEIGQELTLDQQKVIGFSQITAISLDEPNT